MTVVKMYTYLGENGTIVSPVLLDYFHITKCYVTADEGKLLTKDNQTFVESTQCSEKEVELWHEVEGQK